MKDLLIAIVYVFLGGFIYQYGEPREPVMNLEEWLRKYKVEIAKKYDLDCYRRIAIGQKALTVPMWLETNYPTIFTEFHMGLYERR